MEKSDNLHGMGKYIFFKKIYYQRLNVHIPNRGKSAEQAKWKKPENAPISNSTEITYNIPITYILIALCFRVGKTNPLQQRK